MKWMIASDIHGSAYYCDLLLKAFKEQGADRLLLLGDILYHGPRNDLPTDYNPKAVTAMLNEYKNDIICVRGNCDAEIDQVVLEFPIIPECALICENGKTIFATHGHKFNCDNLPPLHKGDILLYGHTHVPVCKVFDDYIYMNPGSVSIPKEDSPHSYMLFDGDKFDWMDLDGGEYMFY